MGGKGEAYKILFLLFDWLASIISFPFPTIVHRRDQVEATGSLLCILDSFSTAAVPDCVAASGKVRYEVTVGLDMGLPQIGWATPAFERVDKRTGDGTGDDAHSWACDGARRLAWHGGGGPGYDVTWAAEDVIGVAADLDAGTLSFAKNGEWLEVYSGIDIGSGGGLFPSISLKDGRCEVNLGAAPFKFPGPAPAYAPAAPQARALSRYRGEPGDFRGSFATA